MTASGVGFNHAPSVVQLKNNQSFIKAVEVLQSSEISVDALCHANSIFLDGNPTDAIRRGESQVTSLSGDFYYKPPSPSYLIALLDEFIDDLSNINHFSLQDAIVYYSRLIKIHPFTDANGRVCRALMCALLPAKEGLYVSALYRLHVEKSEYIIASEPYSVSAKEYIDSEFWRAAEKWAVEVVQIAFAKINKTHSFLVNQFALSANGADCIKVIEQLWSSPIVYPPHLSRELSMPLTKIIAILQQLTHHNILVARPMRNPAGAVVFECPAIFNVFEEIDKYLLKK
ncbi:Fic family protein [Pseudoalteromonas luteoviolacea]|uniref:Fido domain-containing protein n=1 Tax=Pseudoalteromonas luteoviolacea S4054 TaxID=1129367 RepID=A0A0F6A6Z3_9GAMM|nr:Fic family protein [Pseudoalteromonas luteoviolacea]AOT11068.1 hypothetical protein S4054249_24860 [Pseudoalteromonas luteoviolacea]AOT15768.1 hypothetical protein S40542_23650 [Pseudoalteromonas luteoviolacea]AOT20889.1 hypothetical protein S4054_24780 [Pseudoalteromonas luteoviolacea]KKE81930.1 hypothetical protein N479_20760 [Pseudoalteromonas luteoviolacea S4054]KZN71092.1 hypothetical protein N481_19630 [Pseudoalteromonas luteoviolacea S4047-1]